jgi:hypothetical protein
MQTYGINLSFYRNFRNALYMTVKVSDSFQMETTWAIITRIVPVKSGFLLNGCWLLPHRALELSYFSNLNLGGGTNDS